MDKIAQCVIDRERLGHRFPPRVRARELWRVSPAYLEEAQRDATLLAIWVVLNITAWIKAWDPYLFILLNLALSFQAAYAAPIIMMSQNRQGQKDRLAAEHDYEVNVCAAEEITAILRHLEYQDDLILSLLHRMEHDRPASVADRPAGAPHVTAREQQQ